MLTTSASSEKQIAINGITVSYEDSGISGTEILPIIFIHGFPFEKSSWQKQFDFFSHLTRIIAYDIRGFGKTENNNEKPSMSLYADDLVKLMDGLKIEKAIVCGISMGGYIILNAIERFPERFESIVLADTQCTADSIEAFDKRHFAIQQIEAGGINEFALAQIKKVLHADTLTNKKDLVEKIRRSVIGTPARTIIGTLNALLQRKDMCGSLKNITVPTLIICGKDDQVTPFKQSEFLFKNIKESTIYVIDKAGHLSNIDQPEEFNKQLSRFVSAVVKDL